ncbi:MAG: hypothetical protein JXR05_13525 [Flavobacteriaceae bacterium]
MQLRIFLHFILWTLVFLQGLIQTLQLPTFLYKVGIPAAVISLFIITNKKRKNQMPYFKYVLLILLISLLSFLINEIPLFNFIYFIMYLTLPYFYFIIILNERSDKLVKKIKSIVVIYILLQIPIGIINFILFGQYEGNAGTLTNNAGSVSAIFPAIISAYAFALFVMQRKIKYILVILGFFLFGLIGEKRAVTIFIPIVIFLVYLIPRIKQRKLFTAKTVSTFITIIILSGLAFYGAVRLNPTLNREGKIGGSFDYQFFVDYTKSYNEIGKHDDFSEMQRVEGFLYFNNYMLEAPTFVMLFGEGAGKLISSRYSKNTNANLMLEFYNVRYGGRMGFVWVLMQIGYLGVIVYLSMFVSFYKRVWRLKRFGANEIAFLVMSIILFLDTLFYSKVFIRYFYIIGVYMFLFALVIRNVNNKKQFLKR